MSKQHYKLTCRLCGKSNIVKHAAHLKFCHQITTQNYYDKFFKKKNEGQCKHCKSPTQWTGRLALGYYEFCCKKCSDCFRRGKLGHNHSDSTKEKLRQKRLIYCQTEEGKAHNLKLSKDRRGSNNPSHRQTTETRERVRNLSRERMKLKIKNGYTPPITNSWCHSKINVNNMSFRSTWEAVFFILNPHLKYEKIRIPYFNPETNDERTYIVDFVDEDTKTLYEIKPLATIKHPKNIAKEAAAKNWCKQHGYVFVCISNLYFEENAKKIDFSLYDSKIYKNMKQFLK